MVWNIQALISQAEVAKRTLNELLNIDVWLNFNFDHLKTLDLKSHT